MSESRLPQAKPREFTPEQQSAIEYRRLDACVVAGPGSGKTTVLVERYKRLVEREGMNPNQILAITFTEKAAANMKSRLAAEFRGDEVINRADVLFGAAQGGREDGAGNGLEGPVVLIDSALFDPALEERTLRG